MRDAEALADDIDVWLAARGWEQDESDGRRVILVTQEQWERIVAMNANPSESTETLKKYVAICRKQKLVHPRPTPEQAKAWKREQMNTSLSDGLRVDCDEGCHRCSGEYCNKHGTDPCDCDAADRHAEGRERHGKSAMQGQGQKSES